MNELALVLVFLNKPNKIRSKLWGKIKKKNKIKENKKNKPLMDSPRTSCLSLLLPKPPSVLDTIHACNAIEFLSPHHAILFLPNIRALHPDLPPATPKISFDPNSPNQTQFRKIKIKTNRTLKSTSIYIAYLAQCTAHATLLLGWCTYASLLARAIRRRHLYG